MTAAAHSGAIGVSSFGADTTIAEALSLLTRMLSEAGIETPQTDARFLLQGLLHLDGAQLMSRSAQHLGSAAKRIEDAALRRRTHEPVSRILGKRAFYGRDFIVTPDVLDPRPDTEAIIDLALDLLRARGLLDAPLSIADIGTGSGILIATLLAELPNARGLATDVSPPALAVAKRNAEALGVSHRARFVATTGLEGCSGPFDLVVSNPPYICSGEIAGLARDVKDFDPALALDGGDDGLRVYREIALDIAALRQLTLIVLEVGATQADTVEEIFAVSGAYPIGRRRDLGGHARAVALEIHL
jgi:release factor glutamine methyltransferase